MRPFAVKSFVTYSKQGRCKVHPLRGAVETINGVPMCKLCFKQFSRAQQASKEQETAGSHPSPARSSKLNGGLQ